MWRQLERLRSREGRTYAFAICSRDGIYSSVPVITESVSTVLLKELTHVQTRSREKSLRRLKKIFKLSRRAVYGRRRRDRSMDGDYIVRIESRYIGLDLFEVEVFVRLSDAGSENESAMDDALRSANDA
jgi:hypothetical protein